MQNKPRDRVDEIGVEDEDYTLEVESRGAYLLQPMKTGEWDRSPLYKCIRREGKTTEAYRQHKILMQKRKDTGFS